MRKRRFFSSRGDEGFTRDPFGGKISKDSPLVRIFGKIDSLQSIIDTAILESLGEDRSLLENIQGKLGQSYPIILSIDKEYSISPITYENITEIENYMENMNLEFSNSFQRFKTPGGITLNECRVRCREAEISMVFLLEQEKLNKTLYAYFNRLSSLFYAMSLKKEKEFN